MIRLKSCPFCGGYAVSHRPSDTHFAFVMCDKCGANTSNSDTLPEQDCIDTWNTRAPDPRVERLVEALRSISKEAAKARLQHGNGHSCFWRQRLEAAVQKAIAALAEYTGETEEKGEQS